MIFIRYTISKKIMLFFLIISIVITYSASIYSHQTDNSNSLSTVSNNLNKLGLLTGDGNGNYNLDSNLKRTEAITFIVKLMGKYEYIQENKENLKKTIFIDVAETDWFAPYVGFCYSNNIVSGYGNQLFGSKDNITEQAFLVMVLKLLKYDDIKWNDNVFRKAYEVGLVADKAYLSRTKDNNSYSRGKAVQLLNTALSTKINGQSKTLIQLLISYGAVNADIAKSLGYDTVEKTDNTDTPKETISVKINEILSVSEIEIAVYLNAELKSISTSNILIYEAGNENKKLNIYSVTPSGNKLIIKTGTQVSKKSYNVELINIKDSNGNIIPRLTGSFSGYKQTPKSSSTPSPTPNPSLVVDSITAINAKQIQIVFNKEMSKSSVEDIKFYEIKDKGTDVISLAKGSVIYNEPTKTAVITLNNKISDKLTNLTTAKFTIKKGIKFIDGSELDNNMEFNVKVEDLDITTFSKVEVIDEKTIKLTCSEPVYDGTNNTQLNIKNFSVELLKPKYSQIPNPDIVFSAAYTYTVQSAELIESSIILTVNEVLSEGDYIVHINSTITENPIQDYAGNILSHRLVRIIYVKTGDTYSQVTVEEADEDMVTLSFSKPVTATDLKLFHTDKTIAANMSTPVSINKGTFVNEITFEFPNKIPVGTTDLFLVNSTDPSCKMFNIFGEYVPDQTLVADVAPEKNPPKVIDSVFD